MHRDTTRGLAPTRSRRHETPKNLPQKSSTGLGFLRPRLTSTYAERAALSTRMLSKAAKTSAWSMPTPMTTRYRLMGPCQLPSLSKESLRLPLMLKTDLNSKISVPGGKKPRQIG